MPGVVACCILVFDLADSVEVVVGDFASDGLSSLGPFYGVAPVADFGRVADNIVCDVEVL